MRARPSVAAATSRPTAHRDKEFTFLQLINHQSTLLLVVDERGCRCGEGGKRRRLEGKTHVDM